MRNTPLMPKATAVWLIDNTALTFTQIAALCSLHELEVQGIADGEVAVGIKGQNPVLTGQISRTEIEKAEKDPSYRIQLLGPKHSVSDKPRTKGPRYTPLAKRQDRPNAILWLLRQHPELRDAQISRIVGTTKPTIDAVRDRTHWNSANLTPVDPVSLGLCSQIELDAEVKKVAKYAPERKFEPQENDELLMKPEASLSTAFSAFTGQAASEENEEAVNPDDVFAKFTAQKPESEEG